MKELTFRWVGLNKHFNEIQINNGLTTKKILNGECLSFFNESNRGESGNCEFLSEDLCATQKDKNGNDVYDGDIVNYMGENCVMKVEYSKVDFGFVLKEKGKIMVYNFTPKSIEVIGNIYENNNLIKLY